MLSQKNWEQIKSRVRTTTDLKAAVEEADLITEAVHERMDIKKARTHRLKDHFGICVSLSEGPSRFR